MKLKHSFPLILIVVLFGCNTNRVTQLKDYNTYLSTEFDKTELLSSAQIWTNKLETTPNQFPYLTKRANSYTQLFNATGDINYLKKAEEDLVKAIEITNGIYASHLKSLAINYISQHRFKEALELLKKAEANGEKLNGTKKMLFDVHLELGNYIAAEAYLKQIKNTSDFDYLIRLAKWEDHNGNLDEAIGTMEKAALIAEASKLKGTMQWSYTNLADFYGHAGEIEKSYSFYLKALKLDPNDAYAKKGIAWILFSHENNSEEALKILDHISTYFKAPDYDLLKAEIAGYINDKKLKSTALASYQKAVENKHYGDMYNTYNIMVYTEDMLLPKQAIDMAMQEVENRPTPQSYDLLAWSYFKNGDVEKANAIIELYVDGQTSEPDVLYHIAEIYKAVGKMDKVKALKGELVASLYELGPTMEQKIKQL